MKLDLHVHSRYSRDAKAAPSDIVRHCKRIGLDGCAVTDHNEIKGSIEAVEFARAEGLLVLPAVEVSSKEGHILAYGVRDLIPRDLSIQETVEKIGAAGGVAVAAHPDRFPSGIGLDLARSQRFHAIEVLNGGSSARSNRLARDVAVERSMPMTAGSDAHELEKMGKAFTSFDGASTVDDVLDCIAKGRTAVSGRSRSGPESIVYAVEIFFGWLAGGFRRL